MYHGTPDERARLRNTEMVVIHDRERYWLKKDGPAAPATPTKPKARGRPPKRGKRGGKASGPSTRAPSEEKEDPDLPPHQKTTFPVVITTYDILMKDRPRLAAYRWGFIVVDEGHRLKNMDCKLVQEIKMLKADARMILTGTPLHVSNRNEHRNGPF